MATAAAQARRGDHPGALSTLEAAVTQSGGDADLWMALGQARAACGQAEAALEALDEALRAGHPLAGEVRLARAVILADQLHDDREAKRELEALLDDEPWQLRARLNLGNLYEQRGERHDAMRVYREAMDQDPSKDPSNAALRWVAVARMLIIERPDRADDARLAEAKRGLTALAGDHAIRAHLLFAIGHCHEAFGDEEAAFDAFSMANRGLLRLHGRTYRAAEEERLVAAIMAATPAMRMPAVETTDPLRPVFICGMFRSGSTLLEQMLATHPSITPAGELDWLPRLAFQRHAPFPSGFDHVSADELAALAQEYLAALRKRFPDLPAGALVTDKRPDNYLLIGVIKALFPAARILHTVRHPMDNGLSIYMQNMNLEVAAYASDLGDIGHQYGLYTRLMDHWKARFPGDILDVAYEDLVADPGTVVAGIEGFLGLARGADSSAFHHLPNAVKTASYWQVRRPLYRDAMGRWERYAAQLEPLRRALAGAGITLPDPSTIRP